MPLDLYTGFDPAPATGDIIAGVSSGSALWTFADVNGGVVRVTPDDDVLDVDIVLVIDLSRPDGHGAGSATLSARTVVLRAEWTATDTRRTVVLRIEHRSNNSALTRAFVDGIQVAHARLDSEAGGSGIGFFTVSVAISNDPAETRVLGIADMRSLQVNNAVMSLSRTSDGENYLVRDQFTSGAATTGRTVETQVIAAADWVNTGFLGATATPYGGSFSASVIPPGIQLSHPAMPPGNSYATRLMLRAVPAMALDPEIGYFAECELIATDEPTGDGAVHYDFEVYCASGRIGAGSAGYASSGTFYGLEPGTYTVRATVVGGMLTWYLNGVQAAGGGGFQLPAPTAYSGDPVITELWLTVTNGSATSTPVLTTIKRMEFGALQRVYTPRGRFWTGFVNTQETDASTLTKLSVPTVTPGTAGTMAEPGSPAIPAYTSYEEVVTCGFTPVLSTLRIGSTTRLPVGRTFDSSALSYAGTAIYQTKYSCEVSQVATYHPGVPARPAVPGTAATPDTAAAAAPAWDASARSVQLIPVLTGPLAGQAQYFEFGILADPLGVSISLVNDPTAPADAAVVAVFRGSTITLNGTAMTPVTVVPGNLFAIVVHGTTADLRYGAPGDGADGALVGTVTVPLDTYFVRALLYSQTDTVLWPRFMLLADGTAPAEPDGYTGLLPAHADELNALWVAGVPRIIPTMRYFGRGVRSSVGSPSLGSTGFVLPSDPLGPERVVALGTTPTFGGLGFADAIYYTPIADRTVYLRDLQLRAGDGPYADLRVQLPGLTMLAQDSRTALNYGEMTLGLMGAAGVSLVGGIGDGTLTLAGLALAGGSAYAKASLAMEKMQLFAPNYEGPGDATAGSLMLGADTLTAEVLLIVEMTSTGAVSSVLAVEALWDAAAVSVATASNTTVIDSVLDAVLMSFASASGPDAGVVANTETWVVNLDSSASTRYTGYDFNSFARIGGKHYGARADGLYLLDGDTDAGAAITGRVQLGRSDMNSPMRKRLESVYAAVSSTDVVYLKVTNEDGEVYTYSARRSSTKLEQQRIDVGRGISANYLTFELEGSGADFEVAGLEFNAVVLTRRIR